MVKITEELVRKKAEHNEGEICTLEELSLHQENIDKIEHLHNWCKDLQILLLQGNIISKIENLHKLKRLQYLNLALNNIELIENLDRCESLEKLDLTLNFIGNIESISNLENNIHLRDLYLTGNPCTDFTGYREYVITKLPQINNLDNHDITKSERLKAFQLVPIIERSILIDQNNYILKRNEQRLRLAQVDNDSVPDDEFWKQKTEHCPEVRVEMARRQRRAKNDDQKDKKNDKPVVLFHIDGRPLNINHAKIKFTIEYEDINEIILDLHIYKHLDTNLLDVDIQPTYVRVLVKNKVFQIVLPEEIITEKSSAQRSLTTGHLVIKMLKLHQNVFRGEKAQPGYIDNKVPTDLDRKQRREFLEIGPDRLTQICNISQKEPEFIDDDSVPPLE